MTLSIIPPEIMEGSLFSKLTAEELANFTTANKDLYQLRAFDPRWSDSLWKEKVQELIQQGKGFRLAGFDDKTLYLINKTDIQQADEITQGIIGASSSLLKNVCLISAVQIGLPMTELVSYYSEGSLSILSVEFYVTGYYLILFMQKIQKKFGMFVEKQLNPAYEGSAKIFTYLKNFPDVPDRMLPFYARCFVKAVQSIEKTKSFFSPVLTIGSRIRRFIFSAEADQSLGVQIQ